MSVKKPFAFLKGTDKIYHASEALPGQLFEYNDRPVHPAVHRWFSYNPSGHSARRERFSDARESAAHIGAKRLLSQGISINCVADGERLLLRLKDVALEAPANGRIPDATGIVEYCVPFWNIHSETACVEVHFANRVKDPRRIEDLRALNAPVLEVHLQVKYIKSVEEAINNPIRFLALLEALMTYGTMAATWIRPPVRVVEVPSIGAFE